MNPHRSTSTRQTTDPSDIALAIDRYQPALLNETQAHCAVGRMREIARAAEPRSQMDALNLLATLSRFLTDTATPDSCDVDALLTETSVASWTHRFLADGGSDSSYKQHRARLGRLLRAAAGEAPLRTQVSEASARNHPEPYVLDALVEVGWVLTSTEPDAAALLVAMASAGRQLAEATGRIEATDDGAWFVDIDGASHRVEDPWHALAADIAGRDSDPAAWTRLRSVQAPALGTLSASRLRATWAHTALTSGRPLATSLRSGRKLADAVLPWLPTPSRHVADAYLRG